jgi:hypothetical protein
MDKNNENPSIPELQNRFNDLKIKLSELQHNPKSEEYQATYNEAWDVYYQKDVLLRG